MATILVELYRHNLWANLALLDVCAGLSEEQLDLSAPSTYGRVRDTLLHLVVAEGRYLARLSEGQRESPNREEPTFPGVHALREQARRSGEGLITLAEQHPSGTAITGTWCGKTYRMASAVPMGQAINHATEHRSHIVSILTQNNVVVPELDFWAFGAATGLDPLSG